ncbi:putative transport protein HsrA [Aeromonas salmonicida]
MPDSTHMVTPAQRKWLAAVGFFMQTLDGTILNTALPSMAETLGESPLQMQSVIIAYMLTVALLIPASGWLADRFGTRRIYLAAILLFTLGSLACAAANTLPMLVAARVLQGIGGALLMPVGRLAVLRVYSKHELLRVMSFVTIPGLVGPLIGPALGGWLVEVASWHWVFLINLPVGILGFIASWHFMPDLRQGTAKFDWQGFVLFSAGMVLVSVGLQGLGEHSISTGWALFALLFGLAAMASYWLYAANAEQPLFSLALFKTSTFAIGVWGNLFARLGSGAMPFLTPLFLQLGLGFSPSKAGMTMIPTVLGAMLTKTLVNKLIPRIGYRRILIGNTLALGVMIANR